MTEPATLTEAVGVFQQLTADGASADEAALALCRKYPGIAEPWQLCTRVYRLAGAPCGDEPESMARWFNDRRG